MYCNLEMAVCNAKKCICESVDLIDLAVEHPPLPPLSAYFLCDRSSPLALL